MLYHGNFGFPAELLFSCCKSLYTTTVPLLLSLPCREVSAPCLPQHPGCHRLMAGATRGRGVKSWAWELCCALAGGPSLPTVALSSLPDPAPGSRAPAAPACCRPAKGNEGFFCYLYLWQRSNTNVKSRLILSFLYIKASTQSRCSQIYYPLYCAYWF